MTHFFMNPQLGGLTTEKIIPDFLYEFARLEDFIVNSLDVLVYHYSNEA